MQSRRYIDPVCKLYLRPAASDKHDTKYFRFARFCFE